MIVPLENIVAGERRASPSRMRFREGTAVLVKSIDGTVKPRIPALSGSNWSALVGERGIVVRDPICGSCCIPFRTGTSVLVQFDKSVVRRMKSFGLDMEEESAVDDATFLRATDLVLITPAREKELSRLAAQLQRKRYGVPARESLSSAAKRGVPGGLDWLAEQYLLGQGVKRDHRKAFLLMKRATSRSEPSLMPRMELGLMYMHGIGVRANLSQAIRLFRQDLNFWPGADRLLGICNLIGRGRMHSSARAMGWFVGGPCVTGDAAVLGARLRKRSADAKDMMRAFRIIQARASSGAYVPTYVLGLCYEYGLGTQRDERKAFELYRRAAALDDADARLKVAECYLFGSGTQQRSHLALRMLRRIARPRKQPPWSRLPWSVRILAERQLKSAQGK